MIERDMKSASARQQKSRSRRLSLSMRIVLAIVLASFAACAGGSGSGGFDISPSAENELITQVLTVRECQPTEALTICPANEDALHVPGQDNMPAPEGVQVSTNLDPAEISGCALGEGPTCTLAVQVTIDGLPPGGAYQLAARGFEPLSSWTVAGGAVAASDVDPTAFTALIEVPSGSTALQIAVLVFDDAAGTAAGEIRTLTETGASFAFVADPTPIGG